MKGRFSAILRVVVSVSLLGILLWSARGHFSRIGETLVHANLGLFLLAIGLFIFNVLILSLRLNLLFAGEGLMFSLGKVLQLSFIGYFFNNFMPTAVGGDIIKGYYAHKQTHKTAKAFIAVFMDRFIGLFSFICIAVLALIFSWQSIDFVLKKIVLFFGLAGIAGFILIMNDRVAKTLLVAFSKFKLWNIGEKVSKVYRAVHEYKNKKGLILAVIGISIVCQSVYFTVVYLLAKALGADVMLRTIFLIMPVVSVISMLPSLGGLGLREGAIVGLFGPAIGTDRAFSLSILILAALLSLSLIGGIIYAFAAQFKIKGEELSKLERYNV